MISSTFLPLVSGNYSAAKDFYIILVSFLVSMNANEKNQVLYLFDNEREYQSDEDKEDKEDVFVKERLQKGESERDEQVGHVIDEYAERHDRATRILTKALGCVHKRNWTF